MKQCLQFMVFEKSFLTQHLMYTPAELLLSGSLLYIKKFGACGLTKFRRTEQYFAAHIVNSYQQHLTILLHERELDATMLNNVVQLR